MFLIDTDVLSELRKRRRNPGVDAWIASRTTDEIFLSVVTVGEIERGIEMAERRDPDLARAIGMWLGQVLALYGDHILAFDLHAARRWGRLTASVGNENADTLIAATALEHRLTMVTRNIAHFSPTGVPTFNPFT